MLKLAFLVLSLNPDGQMRMTLAERDTMEACQATATQIGPVLERAGYTVLAMRCDETDLHLVPYKEVPKDAPLHLYKVTLTEPGGFTVAPVAAGQNCVGAPTAAEPSFCALSGQTPVTDDQKAGTATEAAQK